MSEVGKWMDEGEGGIKDGDAWGQMSGTTFGIGLGK